MKRVLPKITAVVLLALAVTACSGQQGDTAQVSGTVEVLAPINDGKNGYTLKFIELSGLDNLREVTGRFVRFFISPRILDNRLNGPAPQGRFIKNTDGKYIPANEQSQQLVAIYAHMQNLAKLDQEVGAGNVNHWPRDIGVAVRETSGMTNNALYDGTTDSILIVPYTKSDLPIAVNGGILAHEHFHSLYFKLVMKSADDADSEGQTIDTGSIHDRHHFLEQAGIADDDHARVSARSESRDALPTVRGGPAIVPSEKLIKKYYNRYFQRGLNEGLADFWAWVYTGDPDFIAASIPSMKLKRTLTLQDYEVASVERVEEFRFLAAQYGNYSSKADFENDMLVASYKLGTEYSRLLKLFTEKAAASRDINVAEMRKKVGAWVVAALPDFRQDFINIDSTGYYPPSRFLKVLANAASDLNQKECEFLKDVINSTENSVRNVCAQDGNRSVISEAK